MRVRATVVVELPDDLEEGQVPCLLGILGSALAEGSVPVIEMWGERDEKEASP